MTEKKKKSRLSDKSIAQRLKQLSQLHTLPELKNFVDSLTPEEKKILGSLENLTPEKLAEYDKKLGPGGSVSAKLAQMLLWQIK
jgi:hypothetical protein